MIIGIDNSYYLIYTPLMFNLQKGESLKKDKDAIFYLQYNAEQAGEVIERTGH